MSQLRQATFSAKPQCITASADISIILQIPIYLHLHINNTAFEQNMRETQRGLQSSKQLSGEAKLEGVDAAEFLVGIVERLNQLTAAKWKFMDKMVKIRL